MSWFGKKIAMTDDESTLIDWDEATLGEPVIQHSDPMIRKLINGATILVVVVLLGISAHWWLGSAAGLWATVFPPPPYTGALVYGVSGGSLVAIHFTDGHVQWRVKNIGNENMILHDTKTIYVVNSSNQVEALQAQTGKQVWHLQIDPPVRLTGEWLDENRLYIIANGEGSLPTSSLLEAIDAHSGHVLWKSVISGTNGFLASVHASQMLLCATVHNANTAATTIILSGIEGQTGKPQWQQSTTIAADGGYSCGIAGDFAFIQSFGNTMENTLSLVNEQTGVIQRQVQLLGQIVGEDQHVIYTLTEGPPTSEQEIQAVSLDNGALLWHITGNYLPFYIPNSQFNSQGIVLPPPILIAADTNGLVRINTKTGTVVWQWENDEVNAISGGLNTSVAGEGSSLYFRGQASAYALDSATGKLLWHTPIALSSGSNIQLLYGSKTLFIASQGQFQALQALNGKVLWKQALSFQNIFCLTCSG